MTNNHSSRAQQGSVTSDARDTSANARQNIVKHTVHIDHDNVLFRASKSTATVRERKDQHILSKHRELEQLMNSFYWGSTGQAEEGDHHPKSDAAKEKEAGNLLLSVGSHFKGAHQQKHSGKP